MHQPKHRLDTEPRTQRLQPAPRHRADRYLERVGALGITIDDIYGILRRDDFPNGVPR